MDKNQRIPKIIHYCWFGGKKKPEKVKATIANWREMLPEYQIIEWNDDNFDVNMIPYTRQAYEAKGYAFVSDYARLYVLYQMGGIYLDTDVVLLHNFDDFLNEKAFMSFESARSLCTAVIGAEKESQYIAELLEKYRNIRFINDEGKIDWKPNSERLFHNLFKHKMNRSCIYEGDIITIYPVDYFCAKDYKTYKMLQTDHTVAIHMLEASWYPWNRKLKKKIKKIMIKMKLGFLWDHE
jgi:hypothetical protein